MKSVYPRHASKTKVRNALRSLLLIVLTLSLVSIGSFSVVYGTAGPQSRSQSSTGPDRSDDNIWQSVDPATLLARAELASPDSYRVLQLNADRLMETLSAAPMEFTEAAKRGKVVVSLPMPDGTFGRFAVEESPAMEPDLAAQFPEVKSYRGQGIDDPTATARFDWSPFGFHALALTADGSVFIAPYTAGDIQHYISFYEQDLREGFEHPRCETMEKLRATGQLRRSLSRQLKSGDFELAVSVGSQLRTYRLAIATTIEYTGNSTYGGGKAATLTKLNTFVNLINAIYEKETSIRFQLVANELSIIFDSGDDGLTNGSPATMLDQSTGVINNAIGSGAYDVGHAFGLGSAGGSAGIAGLGVVCGSFKGRGASSLGIALVTGNFAIDSGLVAHEWGHQFSANHTFNSSSGNCAGSNRNPSTAYEAGSGSTVMSYAGTCSPENLQNLPDGYFHANSFDAIANYAAGSGACAASTATGNTPPTVSAGSDFTIPMSTPFTLTATGSDPDGDTVSYSWEQMDLGTASPPMTDGGNRPIFRSFLATTSPSRTFPKLSSILSGAASFGENLPTTNRAMNFRVTARDNRANGGGVNNDATVLTVTTAAGPFVVTSPNTAVSWSGGTSQTVTWTVAGTSGAPVNCANVTIKLSTDGGNTYPTTLAASTPNDGSQSITVPNVSTGSARVRVEGAGNVFFDVSNANFTIVPSSSGSGTDTAGLYNPVTSTFFLRNTNNTGPADFTFGYGPAGAGWLPVAGDWNGDGVDTIGLFDPVTSFFFLNNSNATAPADIVFSYGPAGAGWIPIAGDWNGDGTDTIGLYNPATSTFFLRNTNNSGPADLTFVYGPAGAGWRPLAGDWNSDSTDTIGLYNPATSTFFLRNSNSSAPADITFGYGPAGAGWTPVAGDWNGDGVDTVGLFDPASSTFFLRNANSTAPADITFGYGPAGAGWKPTMGDWDSL